MDRISPPFGLEVGKVTGVQDVGQFGDRIGVEHTENPDSPAHLIEVDATGASMRLTAHHHNATPRSEAGRQVMVQHEMAEMVDSEVNFKAILGQAPHGSDPGVVDEDVENPPGFGESAACRGAGAQ